MLEFVDKRNLSSNGKKEKNGKNPLSIERDSGLHSFRFTSQSDRFR